MAGGAQRSLSSARRQAAEAAAKADAAVKYKEQASVLLAVRALLGHFRHRRHHCRRLATHFRCLLARLHCVSRVG